MNLENSWHVVLPKATYGDGNGELSVESGVNVPEVDGGGVAGVAGHNDVVAHLGVLGEGHAHPGGVLDGRDHLEVHVILVVHPGDGDGAVLN